MGFTQSTADLCICTSVDGRNMYLLGVYVDDIVIAGASKAKIEKIKGELNSKFDMKNLGKLNYFLGMKVKQNLKEHEIWIGEPVFIEQLPEDFQINKSKPVGTLANLNQKLFKTSDEEECIDQHLSLVGSC